MTKMDQAFMSCYMKAKSWKANARKKADAFIHEERGGAEIIAAIILVAVVVVLAVAFRGKIQELLTTIWDGVDDKAAQLGNDLTIGGE